jgi:hypothetical protein
VDVFKNGFQDCTGGGWSSKHKTVTVVNVDGPTDEAAPTEAFALVPGPTGQPILVPAVKTGDDEYQGFKPEWLVGPMFGGNYAGTSDSRFGEALKAQFGIKANVAVPIHDRFETAEQYAALSI